MEYVIIAPDGTRYTGTVGSDGKIHQDNLPPGECKIIFKDLLNAHWESDMVNCGEEIRLLVECPAHDEGDSITFEIYKRFTEESGDVIATLDGTVDSQSQAEATWTYEYQEEDEGTKPEFVFKAKSGSLEIISDVLTVVDTFEANLKDADGQPVANEKYILTLPDGSTREGVSDDEGKVLEEELPVGDMRIRMEDGSELEQT